jgi:hypothetical protein
MRGRQYLDVHDVVAGGAVLLGSAFDGALGAELVVRPRAEAAGGIRAHQPLLVVPLDALPMNGHNIANAERKERKRRERRG